MIYYNSNVNIKIKTLSNESINNYNMMDKQLTEEAKNS